MRGTPDWKGSRLPRPWPGPTAPLVVLAALLGAACRGDRPTDSETPPRLEPRLPVAPSQGEPPVEALPVAPPTDILPDSPPTEVRTPARVAERYDLVGVDRERGRAMLRLFDRQDGAGLRAAVVDVRSGQVLERHSLPTLGTVLDIRTPSLAPESPVSSGGRPAPQPGTRAELLAEAAEREEVAAYLQIVRPGGTPIRDTHVAVGPDDRHVLLAAGDWLYRSEDGGSSFSKVVRPPLGASYHPFVAASGEWAAFRACGRPCRTYFVHVLPLRPGSSPTRVSGAPNPGETLAFSPDGRFLFAASGSRGTEGGSPRGCLVRIELERPTRVEELVCVPHPTYSAAPVFAASWDGTIGVLLGDTGGPPDDRRMPYAWVSLADPETRGSGVVAARPPVYAAVDGASRRVVWRDVGDADARVLDLATGAVTRRPLPGLGPPAFWDTTTLLVVGSAHPTVELVPIDPGS